MGLEMDTEQMQQILDTLKEPNPSYAKLRALEKLGEPAFDVIAGLLRGGELRSAHRLHALRRLALLTRQQCFERTEELLRLAFAAMQDTDQTLRSGATSMAITVTAILEKNPNPIRSPEMKPGAKPSLREQVQAKVRLALKLGLTEQEADFARKFLANER